MLMKTATRFVILIPVCLALNARGGSLPPAPPFSVWPVDSMEKVFKDTPAPASPAAAMSLDAARNEVISGQAVVRCPVALDKLVCSVSPLLVDTQSAQIPSPQIRFVGYVPVQRGDSPHFSLRERPCDYPDPLLEVPPVTVPANTTQPIWLTIHVPSNAVPGLYRGSIVIEASANGRLQHVSLPLQVRVYAATLPRKRTLSVSNWSWFDTPEVAALCGVKEVFSEPYWKLMEAVAADMAAHRQTSILTPTVAWTWKRDDPLTARDLITCTIGKNGQLAFDFSLFDRWVRLFRAAGVDGLIEGGTLAKSKRHDKVFRTIIWKIDQGKAVKDNVDSTSPACEAFLAAYLPALQAHLQAQGWLTNYVQHVMDEPNGMRKAVYVKVAGYVRKYAPKLRILDAVQFTDLVGSIDVWAPTLPCFIREQRFFAERRAKGEEVWFYTCLIPAGPASLNRFVEYPLTRVRLLHWLNYAGGATGYLHWGYNWWIGRTNPMEGKWLLEPGDEWSVYPKPDGVLDSIRTEAMLEGIQDYELLQLLASKDHKAADALCASLVRIPSPTADSRSAIEARQQRPPVGEMGSKGYEFDDSVTALRTARRALLTALSTR